ncbi:MAG TPA: CapA family protein, partial [Candidatus Blautia excrementigallinarum]|nr:CapA family protein [Candidatus Blautia excrementigallinarum]
NTDLLDVTFDYELNMYDPNGNIVEDVWSITADQYRQEQAEDSSEDEYSDEDGSESYDESEYY